MASWKGELRLAHVDVDRVTFYLHPDDPPFELTPNKRYATVMIEIDDNERLDPKSEDRRAVTKSKRNPSNVAAILCKDPMFQAWASAELKSDGHGTLPPSEESATELIRIRCSVKSRAELDIDPLALVDFQTKVEVPYYRFSRQQKG